MNYDNFEKYLKGNEVYSNELNVVLTKTPPKLFKLIILAIALGLLIFGAFAFFIKTKEFASSTYVMQVNQPGHRATISCLTNELELGRIMNTRSAVIESNTAGSSYGKKEIHVSFDTLYVTPVYELNGHLYDSPEQVKEKLLASDALVKRYRIDIQLDSLSTAQYFGNNSKSQAGSIKFTLGERRLISKFVQL